MTKGTQEMSIEKGETIRADWETWSEREGRIQDECERSGEVYRRENDWNITDRQAEDYERQFNRQK